MTPTPQLLPLPQQFAHHIQARRMSLGYTQRELASKIGASQATIARIEAGTANPSIKTLERIMYALQAEVSIRISNRPR